MIDEIRSAGDGWTAGRMSRVAAPLRDQVSSVLRKAIVERELRPGQRLVERELTDRLQVSRATIRESLRELEAEGLVTVIPQRGAVVASISPREAEDIYEARAAIESLIVRHFVDRASDGDVGKLASTLEPLRAAIDAGRPVGETLACKDQFYAALLAGADSTVLATLLSSLQARVSLLRATSLAHPGRPAEMLSELQALVRAISARDADEAARLCAVHVRNAGRVGLDELAREEREERAEREEPVIPA
ncbi:MAG TPA: GntR family transcriptional regulator [Trebonia sp.]